MRSWKKPSNPSNTRRYRIMFKIDWLGMTATIVIDFAVECVIVVDSQGNAVIMEAVDIEVVQIDLPEFVLDCCGPDLGPLVLDRLLAMREVMLAKEAFEKALDEYHV